jgi:hypothetical protein
VDDATETLLRELQSSPTDLRKLVAHTVCRTRTDVAIEAEAIARWKREDPGRWTAVQEWLVARGIRIMIVTAAHAAAGRSRRVDR